MREIYEIYAFMPLRRHPIYLRLSQIISSLGAWSCPHLSFLVIAMIIENDYFRIEVEGVAPSISKDKIIRMEIRLFEIRFDGKITLEGPYNEEQNKQPTIK